MPQSLDEKLAVYRKRQPAMGWTRDYCPAIFATPREGPRISRPTQLASALVGRSLQLLSQPEANAALLALYSGIVFDIHEQKLLSCVPDVHPLNGHPDAAGVRLPEVQGTVRVAERLGVLETHPKFLDTSDPERPRWVPVPYVGDLLLYLRDEQGVYCVNWTVKLTKDDFHRRGPHMFGRPRKRSPDPGAERRHLIEEQYYLDAGIRTVRVTGCALCETLLANLRELFLWHHRSTEIAPEMATRVTQELAESVGTSVIALELIETVAKKLRIEPYVVRVLLSQGVWNRHIRIDLFRPFLMDRPLYPERLDPVVKYRHWFER